MGANFITSITIGFSPPKTPSKRTMRINIVEMMVVHKKDNFFVEERLESHILEFRDNEKVHGIFKDIFPLVITKTMINFNISRVLINKRSSCDIM